MPRSFRLKIGLLSFCLSGLLLLGFGVFAVSALHRLGIDRIDRELRALADAQVRRQQPRGHWRVFDDSLRSVYGEDSARTFAVKATRPDGETLYATQPWPATLPFLALPLPVNASDGGAVENAPSGANNPPRPPAEMDPRRPPPRDTEERQNPPPRRLPVHGPVYATLGQPPADWRAMTLANPDVTLSLAMDLSALHAETRRFRRALLIFVPLSLLLLTAGGWLIGHFALRPVNLIARTAESVTARRLDARIPDTQADVEFRRLITLINGMLERLERGFRQATRFSADAAHELKTPLAILQARVERSLQLAADGSPEQADHAEQLEEVQRLKIILGKLLLLSQADSGHLPLSPESINLADNVRAAAEDVRMLAPDRQTTVEAPEALWIMGDAHLLNQVFQNLISNAVKFGDKDGVIAMTLGERAGQAVFTISNTGRPIPKQDHDKVFDRFYRADKARSREIEGSGLGLSLARELARAHGGDLRLDRSEENLTAFTLRLPLAGAAKPFSNQPEFRA